MAIVSWPYKIRVIALLVTLSNLAGRFYITIASLPYGEDFCILVATVTPIFSNTIVLFTSGGLGEDDLSNLCFLLLQDSNNYYKVVTEPS